MNFKTVLARNSLPGAADQASRRGTARTCSRRGTSRTYDLPLSKVERSAADVAAVARAIWRSVPLDSAPRFAACAAANLFFISLTSMRARRRSRSSCHDVEDREFNAIVYLALRATSADITRSRTLAAS